VNTGNYSEEELNDILRKSISEFRKLLKKENKDYDKCFPDPREFRYLHEFKNHDHTKGGILVVGLNPHIGKNEKDSKWRERYSIDERNTSDRLLLEYHYFKKFTAKSEYNEENNEKYNMDLVSVNPNVKFTDVVLIRSSSKNDLKDMLSRNANGSDDNLCKAIELGWKNHMIELLELIRPDVMVCNSVDLSWFLEEKSTHYAWERHNDIINIRLEDFFLPCVLSGQVTGQRATDKWTLIRLRNSIIDAIKN
jgi:hypothetical protein